MPRRYFRRRYSRKNKYSVERTFGYTDSVSTWTQIPASNTTIQNYQTSVGIVPATELQGMRKVKNFTLSFAKIGTVAAPMVYALVYTPAGTSLNNLNYPAVDNSVALYEPNQFVISSGLLQWDAGPMRIHSRLSRNLNSGDTINLILASPSNNGLQVAIDVTYAITLQ